MSSKRSSSRSSHFLSQGLRLGLSEEMLLSVLRNASSPSSQQEESEADSDLSISLKSSLFSDSDSDSISDSEHHNLSSAFLPSSLSPIETSTRGIKTAATGQEGHYDEGRVEELDHPVRERGKRHWKGGREGAEFSTSAQTLRDELESVRHEKKLLELDYERVERVAQRQIASLSEKLRSERQDLTRRLRAQEDEVEELKRKLALERAWVQNGVECSASLFEELSQKKEEELSVKELIQYQVFQLTASQRRKIAELKEESKTAKAKCAEYKDLVENHEHVVQRVRDKLEARIRDLEIELADAKSLADSNKGKFLDSLKHTEGLHERASMYTRIKQRCDDLEADRARALEEARIAVQHRKQAEDTLATKADQLANLTEQLELLKVDKTYLQHERDDAKQALLRAEQALDREREKVSALEQSREALREQLFEVSRSAASEYEQKLQSQVEAMRNTNAKQLRDLKETQLASLEQETRSLRAAKEEAINELDNLRSQLSNAREDLEQVRLELATKDASHQAALSELRSQLRMRIFETESLTTTIEEKASKVRKLELTNEMLENKLDVLKSEFVAMETATSKQIVELNAKVASQEEKLNVYEALETELDHALLDRAKFTLSPLSVHVKQDHLSPQEQADADVRAVDKLVADQRRQEYDKQGRDEEEGSLQLLPVAAQRRVKHSILLAQRLVKTERLLETSRAECRERQSTIQLLKSKLELAERAADAVTQPQAYLVEKLQSRQEEISQLQARVVTLEKHLENLQQECQSISAERDELFDDLQTVLKERKALEAAVREQAQVLTKSAQEIAQDPVLSPALHSPGFGAINEEQHEGQQGEGEVEVGKGGEGEEEEVVREVDTPDDDLYELNTSVASTRSAASSSFVLVKEDTQGLPLPKWYRKLRQPPGANE